jgi:hypothetical protein
MLPNFLIIGAQKAGSTWIAEQLRQHPEIFLYPEEINFFSQHFDKGVDWYKSLFENSGKRNVIGEKSPLYIWNQSAPERVRSVLGQNVKFIVSLRNPVDRAYSAYWMLLSHSMIPLNTNFIDFFYDKQRDDFRSIGLYSEQIKRYLNNFEVSNILMFIMEIDFLKPRQTIKRSYDFLGVSAEFEPSTLMKKAHVSRDILMGHKFINKVGSVFSNWTQNMPFVKLTLRNIYRKLLKVIPSQQNYTSLSDAERFEIMQTYIDDIYRLEDILQRDLSIWYNSN